MGTKFSYEDGIDAAVKYLEGTASDYDQMADRWSRDERSTLGYAYEAVYRTQAQLLRGQAKHIGDLRAPRPKSRPF